MTVRTTNKHSVVRASARVDAGCLRFLAYFPRRTFVNKFLEAKFKIVTSFCFFKRFILARKTVHTGRRSHSAVACLATALTVTCRMQIIFSAGQPCIPLSDLLWPFGLAWRVETDAQPPVRRCDLLCSSPLVSLALPLAGRRKEYNHELV